MNNVKRTQRIAYGVLLPTVLISMVFGLIWLWFEPISVLLVKGCSTCLILAMASYVTLSATRMMTENKP